MKPQRSKNQEIAHAYMMGVIDTQKKILGLDKGPKPKTNFDKVTASPEKLYEFVTGIMFHTGECRYTGKLKCPNTTCEQCVLEWLKQEAEKETEK